MYDVATKLEAFHDRGGGDHLESHDLEDAMAVVDGREELVAEVQSAPRDVRDYLREEFRRLLSSEDFLNAMPGFLADDEARVPVLRGRLEALAS